MGLAYNPKIVTDGLVLHLDAANAKSYPGGGQWIDISGNGFHHTLSAGSSMFTTVGNVPCIFRDTTNFIKVSGNTHTFRDQYTMTAWARMRADTGTWHTLFRTQPEDHPLLIETGTGRLGFYDNGGTGFNDYGVTASGLNLVETWAYYCIVSSGGSTVLYINGSLVGNSVPVTVSGNTHDAIGGTNALSQSFGHIAKVEVYNKTLSALEIQQNFNALRGRFGL